MLVTNCHLSHAILDSLLQMANDREDTAFAAVVLDAKHAQKEGKLSSYPI